MMRESPHRGRRDLAQSSIGEGSNMTTANKEAFLLDANNLCSSTFPS